MIRHAGSPIILGGPSSIHGQQGAKVPRETCNPAEYLFALECCLSPKLKKFAFLSKKASSLAK
jgi:hypothetical protein